MNDNWSEIKWNKEDIHNLLDEYGCDSSEQAVDSFLKGCEVRNFEEQCIQDGWERLRSAVEYVKK